MGMSIYRGALRKGEGADTTDNALEQVALAFGQTPQGERPKQMERRAILIEGDLHPNKVGAIQNENGEASRAKLHYYRCTSAASASLC